MDLLKIGTQLLMSQLGASASGLSEDGVMKALGSLLPTNDSGDLDLGGLLGQLNSGGLASMAASWLGNGGNDAISGSQLLSLLGKSKVSHFASELSLDEDTAGNALSKMLPELIDKNSDGGSLMDSFGSDLLGSAAKGVLGKMFS